jgi:hypothetical protein
MKTDHDPLRYAIDEGFLKLVWWLDIDGLHTACGALEPVKSQMKIDGTRLFIGGDMYNLNMLTLARYAEKQVGRMTAELVIERFYQDAAESIVAVGELLDVTDAYNARREKEDEES